MVEQITIRGLCDPEAASAHVAWQRFSRRSGWAATGLVVKRRWLMRRPGRRIRPER